jgi:hypothetical protein
MRSSFKLNNAQIAYTLLRSCCSFGKIVYFLRTIPSFKISSTCADFDKRVLTCFENILSVSLDNSSISQASLPLSKSGLGLRSAASHATACFIGSSSSAKNHSPLDISIDQRCIDSYNSRVASPIDSNSQLPQKELSSKIDSVTLENLLASKSMYTKARMKSILGRGASAWLTVIPSSNMSFSNRQYQIAMRLHLGLPVYPSKTKCACKTGHLDRFGIHALACKTKGDIISRHNAVRNVIHNYCEEAGLTAELEKGNLLGDYADKRRPADVLIKNFSLNSDHCLDIAITSPLQDKYIAGASSTEGYAASNYYKFKLSKYAEAVIKENMVFQPIVLETFGRIADKSIPCLIKIASTKADRYSTSRSKAINTFFQQISVALQIRNANMILKRDSFLK